MVDQKTKIVQGGGLTSLVQQLTDAFLHGVDGLKGVTTAATVGRDSSDDDETRPMIRTSEDCEVEDYCRWT